MKFKPIKIEILDKEDGSFYTNYKGIEMLSAKGKEGLILHLKSMIDLLRKK